MTHSIFHIDAAIIALTGATVLMLIGVKEHEIEEVFASVEWVTIFFFAGLFVLVGGLIDIGLIKMLAQKSNWYNRRRYFLRIHPYFMGIWYRLCNN